MERYSARPVMERSLGPKATGLPVAQEDCLWILASRMKFLESRCMYY